MNTALASLALGDPARTLDRHAIRRSAGVPTISVLVGPVGVAGGVWRRWASAAERSVVSTRDLFARAEWVSSVVQQVDLPAAAVRCLSLRAGRDPDEFFGAWRMKTPADREQFWRTLAPEANDDLLSAAAVIVDRGDGSAAAAAFGSLGDRIVPWIVRLVPSARWPSVLFTAGSQENLSAVGSVAAQWALRVPAVPVAVAAPAGVWDAFLTTAPESRTKALLREGELALSGIDPITVESTLRAAGAGNAAAAVAALGADAALVESAVAAVRATVAPPTTQADDDRARSAAERFLFAFLESLPDTVGRFNPNASLDFPFGPRLAEVDLLCCSPRIAIEVDGYFHFLGPEAYRRDRTKDWELQRRGYVVLRFLAEDVIPQLEVIRDRILDALTATPLGGHP